MEKKTTSIKVNPELWKDFKKYAIDKERDLSDILEDLIKREVQKV